MNKILAFLCLLGAAGIALGAFGAHAMKTILTPERLHSFETAVRYQLFHVIIALVMGGSSFFSEKVKKTIAQIFIIGILLFSGSIYMIALEWVAVQYIWFLTPLGGLFLIAGWLKTAFEMFKCSKLRR
jgi:uncharacterized membrane protein YgdD (TMEM256/DUF423 family)